MRGRVKVLVRLWKKGDLRPRRIYSKLYVNIPMAFHDPISHLLGEPCIVIMPKPRKRRYPLAHERNIIRIINHESFHCAIANLRLGIDENSKRSFDKLLNKHKVLKRTKLF